MNRDPGPNFSTRFYANTHKSVGQGKLNPLLHYLTRRPVAKAAPDPSKVLWAAGIESLLGNTQRAVNLAESFLPEDQQYTANLLRANQTVDSGNEEAWLDHVNTFLRSYDVAPLRIVPGEGSLFARLQSVELAPITDGPLVSIIMPAWNA